MDFFPDRVLVSLDAELLTRLLRNGALTLDCMDCRDVRSQETLRLCVLRSLTETSDQD